MMNNSYRSAQQTMNTRVNTDRGYAPQPTSYMPQPAGYAPQQAGYAPQPAGYAPQPAGYAPQPQQAREIPRVTYLTDTVRQTWRDALSQYICMLDTNIFMLYCVETTNTVMKEIVQILAGMPGSFVVACAETRLELENIIKRETGEKKLLAECGLYWYHYLLQHRLLIEQNAFEYIGGDCNGYADAAVLLRLMEGMLLSKPEEKPRALIARDNKLSKDALALAGLKTLSKARSQGGIHVLHVSQYGKVARFDPAFADRPRGAQSGFDAQNQPQGYRPAGYAPNGGGYRGA